jgi:hypothetical protein
MPLISTLSNASASGYRIFAAGEINSYESIATATGTGSSGTISFTSIPSTYKHLQIRVLSRSSESATYGALYVRLGNGSIDTGNNYAWHRLYGDGASAIAGAGSTTNQMLVAMTATTLPGSQTSFGGTIIDVLDYANTSKNKTLRGLTGFDYNGSGYVGLQSGLGQSTSAVTNLDILTGGGNWLANSQFALYGIKG